MRAHQAKRNMRHGKLVNDSLILKSVGNPKTAADDEFEAAYSAFMEEHMNQCSGERLRKLQEDRWLEKKLAENVWWPMFRNFDNLYPEYEVRDFKDGSRFLDYAFIQDNILIDIECDGFETHVRGLSRWQYDDGLQRQNDLIIDGWRVLRFSRDMIIDKPRICQRSILQLLGRLRGEAAGNTLKLSLEEKEILRFALRSVQPITPRDVSLILNRSTGYARKLLHGLVDQEWLQPHSGNARIRSFVATNKAKQI